MSTFYEDVQKIRARYPEGAHSAALPALRLAQEKHGYLSRQALEEAADALGVKAGETTEDGNVTLRAVECLGGCGYATVVAVDHRYRHNVKPEDVSEIVEGLDG